MKLQIVSDLHLEWGVPLTVPNMGADVLILGGDICSTRKIENFLPWFADHADRFKHIVYVMGNHEHYHGEIVFDEYTLRTELAQYSNIHFLENTSVMLESVAFYGCTLWTDCNKADPMTMDVLRIGMNDYRLIKYGKQAFKPEDSLDIHKDSLKSLVEFLEATPGPVVVCTHMAPSRRSIHPRYSADSHMNGGYMSELDQLILDHSNIALWTHGHVHSSHRYMIGATEIVCNPAGYPQGNGKRENKDFAPEMVVTILES